MVNYTCEKCGKDFKQKGQYDRHARRIYPCTDKTTRAPVVPAPVAPKPLAGLKFIDLFCGIGGFHVALESLGGTCVLACDIDAKCREVYKDNYGLEPKEDIKALKSEDIPAFDILCGGFPCQAFSHAGRQGGFEDTRGTLFREICRILRDRQPAYFLLENVKNLKGHDSGKTVKVIYENLHAAGYVTHGVPILLSPHHLGVPQHRERVFLLGIRNDLAAGRTLTPFPAVSPAKTDISSVLEPESVAAPKLSKTDQSIIDLWDEFVQHFKGLGQKLPTFPLWSDDWDSTFPVAGLADFKQKFITNNRAFYKDNQAFLGPWLLRARANPAFVGARRKFEWQCGNFKEEDSLWNLLFTFRPSGIRTKRTNYSPALVAMAQIVIVGARRRKLTPREVARLQSFPDTFKIHESTGTAYKQFGNSVNVEVIKRMAKFLVTEMLSS